MIFAGEQRGDGMSKRLIYADDAIKELSDALAIVVKDNEKSAKFIIDRVPSAQPEGYIKIPETGIDDLSDGFHTFRQLYYQRMMLFATIVKQNKDKAWKSLRHEDGELCFGGGWFIVGIDTPEGSYTYHYEDNYFSLFDCEELERGKHWDGHTEKDVTRLLSLSSAQPDNRLERIADIVEGTIDHLDRDDAMDMLYQIKEVLK